METPTNEPIPVPTPPIVEERDYFEAAEKLRRIRLLCVADDACAVAVPPAMVKQLQSVIDLLLQTGAIAAILNQTAQLRLELDQAHIQNQLLQQMLGAGSGESLADEACLFIGPNEERCTQPATQLLIDTSGQRCPVCDEHARSAPPGLTLVGVQ